MATIEFHHPNASSPTTSVILTNKEQLPYSRPRRRFQSVFEADSGRLFVYDWGSDIQVFSVVLWPLIASEVNAMEAFFHTTTNFRVESFQIVDSLAVTWSVRLNQDVVEAVRVTNIAYRMALAFRVNV